MNKHLSMCFTCAFALLVAPLTLFAACFQGDTNGDGVIDTACEVNNGMSGPSGIEITHPNTGLKSFYAMPSGSSFAINSLADTDGQPGVEVVVVVIAFGNGPDGVHVIHDNGAFQRSYGMPIGSSFSINTVRDTDGNAGAEIVVVLIAHGNGPDGVQVIHDSQASQRLYGMPIGSSFSINTVQDTDGNAGAEIVVVLLANGNGPDGVQVIHDSQASQRLYEMPRGSSFSINTVQDTDGNAGAEIVVVLIANGNGPDGIPVIHDRIASVFTYNVVSPFSILAVHDYDGIPGAEICYTKSSQFFLITDRTHSTTTRSGC